MFEIRAFSQVLVVVAVLVAPCGVGAQTTVLIGGGSLASQGRVNDDPETGVKARSLADTDFSGIEFQFGSVSSGDSFGDAGDARLVLEFDLSSFSTSQEVTDASLHVSIPDDVPPNLHFLARFGNSEVGFQCHRLIATNDGIVTSDDYAGASTNLGLIIPPGVDQFGGSPTEYVLDVTSVVASDVSAGEAFSSFRLQSAPTFTDKSDHYLTIATEGYANPAFRPFLSVTYGGDGGPEPELIGARRVTDFIGANGFPGVSGFFNTTELWREMGMNFYRHDVLWGEVEMSQDKFDFSPDQPYALNHDRILSSAAAGGFEPLVILAYTAPWASTGPAVGTQFRTQFESYFPPQDPADWVDYVEQTVARYTQPPYNVRFFEVWNEPYAEYWQGTREQYVDTILIPASQVIRGHGAKVVGPGWAGAGTSVLESWIRYNDAWKHIDILSTHYNSGDRDRLYNNWIANGRMEGLWHTEVSGWAESGNPFFVAQNYPDALDWYLRHEWDGPDKYKYLYWADGVTVTDGSFLINRNGSGIFLAEQGTAMRTFANVFAGDLERFNGTVSVPSARVLSFRSSDRIILFLDRIGNGGTVTVSGLGAEDFPLARTFESDVVSGDETEVDFVETGNGLRFSVSSGRQLRYVTVETAAETLFLRGDCNGDGQAANIVDALFLLFHNFVGTSGPTCVAACDANGDGEIGGVGDAIFLLLFGFGSGPAPAAPYPNCGGLEESDGSLSCELVTAGCSS